MNILHIAGRELRSIFNSTIGWLVLAGFLFLTGIFWAAMVSWYAVQSSDVIANPYGAQQMTFTEYLLAPFFGNTAVVLLMLCPALSMRLFSEEIKGRTLELLMTSPVSTAEIVLGKYLGALGFVAVMLLGTATAPITLVIWGNPDPGSLIGGYLGLLLAGGAIVAMGMMFSAFTPNQIVALVWTFAAALALWVLSWIPWEPLEQWALISHVQDLLKGILRVSDLAYFGGFIGFFLFATWQRLESFRWS